MIEVIKAIIKEDDKYLIVLRSPNAHVYPKHWDFPGGKLDPGETLKEGVEREVMEETSLKINALEIAATFILEVPSKGQVKFNVFNSEVISGEVKLSDEHTAFKWATKEEILQLKTEPYLQLFFKEH